MEKILLNGLKRNASDIFITAGKVPAYRIFNSIVHDCSVPVTEGEIIRFRELVLGPQNSERFKLADGIDVSWQMSSGERFRINFFTTLNGSAFAARPIASGMELEFSKLALPEKQFAAISSLTHGIVIIAGSTGCGKSTTLGAIINHINRKFSKHILTIEDPVEFTYEDVHSRINQREVNFFSSTFQSSLRSAMRENPDVIVIGELRDQETLAVALSAAQSGHLVITTLHSADAVQAVERMVNFYPENLRLNASVDLSLTLSAVVVQKLLPKKDGSGMVPALEIMNVTPHIRQQIAKNDFQGMESSICHGKADGMNSFNQSLFELYRKGEVTFDTACSFSENPAELSFMKRGLQSGSDTFAPRYAASADENSDLVDMKTLLRTAVRHKASDLLLTCDAPPILRINGSCQALELPKLTPADVNFLLSSVVNKRQKMALDEKRELDFSLSATMSTGKNKSQETHRFRVNAFYQRGSIGVVARVIPSSISTPAQLNLPEILVKLMHKKQGLILVTGPTGSGKSTTMASLLDHINRREAMHIITIEDPIEFVHLNRMSVVEQREVMLDTLSFNNALRGAMREAPDIIAVGELRDPETIASALTAAETGHLVIGTLHTNSAMQTIDRIIDSFPLGAQNQIRQQFASAVLAVVSQRLLRRKDGSGRVAAFEIMVGTPPVQALIRENKNHMLQSVIETAARDGMVTLEKSISDLREKGIISDEEKAVYVKEFKAAQES